MSFHMLDCKRLEHYSLHAFVYASRLLTQRQDEGGTPLSVPVPR